MYFDIGLNIVTQYFVKTTQNSTGGTGTHSAGKLTETEVSGKEDKLVVREERGQAPFIFLPSNPCFIIGCYFILFIYIQLKQETLVRHCT